MENSERDGNTRPPDLPLEKSVLQVKKKQLELDMEKQTGTKSGKEHVKAVCCHLTNLNSMQSTTCKMLVQMKHKLESSLLKEVSIT